MAKITFDTGAAPASSASGTLHLYAKTNNTLAIKDSAGTESVFATGGAGDVVGPSSATDNAVARFDSTTGKLIQNSSASVDDSGNLTATNLSGTNTGDITLAAFGASPGANGASLSGQVLTLQPASATQPGGVTAGAQTFGGAKTITGNADAIQLTVTANATQTGAVFVVENSAGVDQLTVGKTGQATVSTGGGFLVDHMTLSSNFMGDGYARAFTWTAYAASNTYGVKFNDTNAFGQVTYSIGMFLIDSNDTTSVPLVVRGKSSQTANLQNWTNSSNTVLSGIGSDGSLKLNTVGTGVLIKEGTNATMGVATLSGGTVTVNTTKITASSRVFLTHQNVGGTIGVVSLGTVTAGTSFVINSSIGTDTSIIAWLIVEPA